MANVYREDSAPYFNDFETNGKKYHKILFVPGREVQARELLQIQDLFYDQQRMHATKTIQPGVAVSGCLPTIVKKTSLFLSLIEENSQVITTPEYSQTITNNLSSSRTDVDFQVKEVLDSTRTSKWFTEDKFIIIGEYSTDLKYEIGDIIKLDNGDFKIEDIKEATYLYVDRGVVYAEKFFIEQESVLSFILHPSDLVVNHIVGFFLQKEEVTYLTDKTLLDRSSGNFSSNSPGANRLKLSLVYYDFNPDLVETPEGFHKLVEIKEEKFSIINTSRPDFSEVYRRISENTYEANGHFFVKPYKYELKEHLKQNTEDSCGTFLSSDGGDKDKFLLNISPGEAYVYGWNVQHDRLTSIIIDKSFLPDSNGTQLDVDHQREVAIKTSFGQYFVVDRLSGSFSEFGEIISLYDSPQNSWTGDAFSNTGISGNKIGECRLVSVRYHAGVQGSPECQYEIYVSDIKILSCRNLDDIRGIRIESVSIRGIGNVLEMVYPKDTTVKLIDKDIKYAIFPLPNKAIRDITNLDYTGTSSRRVFRGTEYFEFGISEQNKMFPYGVGKLTRSEINENLRFYADNGRLHDIEYAELLSEKQIRLKIDEPTITTGYVVFTQQINSAIPIRKRLKSNQIIKIDMALIDSTNNPGGCSTSNPTFYDGNSTMDGSQDYDGSPITNIDVDALLKPWDQRRLLLGVTDVFNVSAIFVGEEFTTEGLNVKDQFIWNSGQQLDVYGYAYLLPTPTSTTSISGKKVTVILDYFEDVEEENDGYYSVDSYTDIELCQIPNFAGLSLRDSIDFRLKLPSIETTDNLETTSLLSSLPDKHFHRNQYVTSLGLMTVDYSYFLPRYDLLQLSIDGVFSIKTGNPSLRPKALEADVNNIPMCEIRIPPYMSLVNCNSKCSKSDYYITLKPYDYRRYTMRNIKGLDDRITALEYYVSLTLLEQQTENMKILDTDGLDRFKNGFLVDDFSSLLVCDFSHTSTSCSIDKNSKYLRCSFDMNHINVSMESLTSEGVVLN